MWESSPQALCCADKVPEDSQRLPCPSNPLGGAAPPDILQSSHSSTLRPTNKAHHKCTRTRSLCPNGAVLLGTEPSLEQHKVCVHQHAQRARLPCITVDDSKKGGRGSSIVQRETKAMLCNPPVWYVSSPHPHSLARHSTAQNQHSTQKLILQSITYSQRHTMTQPHMLWANAR